MLLLLNSFAHFLVDGVCVSALFSKGAEGETLTQAVVLYNTLAFSTQCMVGLWLNRYIRLRIWTIGSILLIALGSVLTIPYLIKISIVGIGNSVFHVAAGAVTLRCSDRKAWPLGVFVAPGAFGVTLGTFFPEYGFIMTIGLLICAAALFFFSTEHYHISRTIDGSSGFPMTVALLMILAVTIRAVGGTFVLYPWKTSIVGSVLLTAFVSLGKALGGLFCDRFGSEWTSLISIPLAAFLIAFFNSNALLSLLGQYLLNLTMPITLWLLYLSIPEMPAFAFGLAASALWPGTIAGLLIQPSGQILTTCVIISFLFSLFAILIAGKIIKHRK